MAGACKNQRYGNYHIRYGFPTCFSHPFMMEASWPIQSATHLYFVNHSGQFLMLNWPCTSENTSIKDFKSQICSERR
jgi:hypothetical protein